MTHAERYLHTLSGSISRRLADGQPLTPAEQGRLAAELAGVALVLSARRAVEEVEASLPSWLLRPEVPHAEREREAVLLRFPRRAPAHADHRHGDGGAA